MPVSWEVCGFVDVDVPDNIISNYDNVEDYLEGIQDEMALPPDGDYVGGSFEINYECIRYFNRNIPQTFNTVNW